MLIKNILFAPFAHAPRGDTLSGRGGNFTECTVPLLGKWRTKVQTPISHSDRVAVGVENWIHLTYDVKAKGRVGHVRKWSRRSDQNVPTDTHTHTRTHSHMPAGGGLVG